MKGHRSTKEVNKKVLDYIGIAVVALLLIGSALFIFNFSSSGEVDIGNDLNLDEYRAEGIPLDCRLPAYENNIESWKQHLGHHEETLYCMEYFK